MQAYWDRLVFLPARSYQWTWLRSCIPGITPFRAWKWNQLTKGMTVCPGEGSTWYWHWKTKWCKSRTPKRCTSGFLGGSASSYIQSPRTGLPNIVRSSPNVFGTCKLWFHMVPMLENAVFPLFEQNLLSVFNIFNCLLKDYMISSPAEYYKEACKVARARHLDVRPVAGHKSSVFYCFVWSF